MNRSSRGSLDEGFDSGGTNDNSVAMGDARQEEGKVAQEATEKQSAVFQSSPSKMAAESVRKPAPKMAAPLQAAKEQTEQAQTSASLTVSSAMEEPTTIFI